MPTDTEGERMRDLRRAPALRERREQLGLTQQEVADGLARLAWEGDATRLGVNSDVVSKWERGEKRPTALYRRLLCRLLQASDRQLGLRPMPGDDLFEPDEDGRGPGFQPADALETPLDIVERTQWLSSSNSTDALLAHMERLVNAVVDEYEASGPSALAPRVLHQRRAVETLLRGHQHPRNRRELLRTAARLSGLLGYMSVNLGRFPTAAAYCDEAFQLGSHAEDKELQAWSRGTDSLRAYYTGDYKLSVELARDGQRYAANGPQSIRLAINGEARALARLGDVRGTEEAVARAYRASERCTTPDGVSSCISFGPYSLARTAWNAATAYVNLGDERRVQEHVDQALPAFEASTSKWSQSLVRLDLANVLLLDKHPDVERAAALTQEALTISAGKPITSVLHRTREFLKRAAPYQCTPGHSRSRGDAEPGRATVSGVVSGEPGPTAAVIDSVERDWQEFQRLDFMGNHWERPGWAPGRRAYYWYITLGDTPPLEVMAAECQSKLNLPYLDPVPLDGLHLTVQRLAFEDEVAPSQVDATVSRARQLLSMMEAFELSIGPLAGSRGAVRFSVSPWAPIEGLRLALREAISSSTDIHLSRSESDFRPHVGIAYCNARVQAPDLIQRVSRLRHLPTIQTRVSEVSLVLLSRTDRGYCWELLATLPLRAIREVAWL